MKEKIGVYICHCGGNISDYVDVEKVRQVIEKEEGVELALTTMFACGDTNQKQMVTDIKDNKLDAVVVASCSPKLHLPTFQAVSERAGLNKYNYVHANIREQVSWAHSDDKIGATEKAIQIVRAAIAKVRLSEAIEPVEIKTEQSVLVVGAGIAGLKAALSLAKLGTHVYLIEKEPFIGGQIARWDVLFTTDETGKDLITRLYHEVLTTKNVTLFTNAELIENAGSKGNFSAKIKITPRYVKEGCEKDELKKAIDVCPVEVADTFNFGMKKRKAIYHNYPAQYPQSAVIDIKSCTRCGECEKVCSKVDFSQEEQILTLKVGSILVATGFDNYVPVDGEFGYNFIDNVVTLPQFKRLLALNDKKLVYKNKEIKSIAYIYCVGSRQPEGDNKYCSRYCCTSTIHSAIKASEKFKDLNHYHFTRGIRTYGKQESLYRDASQGGQVFLQSYEDDLPKVKKNNDGKTIVTINDILTFKKEIEVEADLVVLVTGMVPREDNNIGKLLKLPKGRDNFFNEIHMKLRPVETVIDGVTIAGTCQGPKNVIESINSALSASIKSYSFVNKETISINPLVADIDSNLCTYCDACFKSCPFDAITTIDLVDGKKVAKINETVCKGCGMCLPVCPVNAIQLRTFSDPEVEQMINVLANEL